METLSEFHAVMLSILSTIFLGGVFYGTVNNRLKKLEESAKQSSDTEKRLTRMETKLDILLQDRANSYGQ